MKKKKKIYISATQFRKNAQLFSGLKRQNAEIYRVAEKGLQTAAGGAIITHMQKYSIYMHRHCPSMRGVLSMVFGLVPVLLVSFIALKTDKALVEETYICYNEQVNVTATDAREDDVQNVISAVAP